MTGAAYLTELEIIRALRLPDKVGRAAFATWRMHHSFPQPDEVTGGRWWFPSVVEWLNAKNGAVNVMAAAQTPIPLPGNKGENFDATLAARKAKRARRSGGAGVDISPAPARVGAVVGAEIGSASPRLSSQDGKVVALRQHAGRAE